MSDIWKDSRVKDALESGRAPDDIAILDCPKCGKPGYYNQGSHFTCLECDQTWYCLSEDEEPPDDRPHIYLDDVRTLADISDEEGEP